MGGRKLDLMNSVAVAPPPPATRRRRIAGRLRRTAGRLRRGLVVALSLLAGLFCGIGWTYFLRGLHWLSAGPPVRDALPLLQLAGYDVQPLVRVIVAWALSGALCGLALRRFGRPGRLALTGAVALALLLLQSQAAYAVTRNLRFVSVLFGRMPGLGPWLEAALFAFASLLAPRIAPTTDATPAAR